MDAFQELGANAGEAFGPVGVATVLAAAAASWALLTIARALTAATKETP